MKKVPDSAIIYAYSNFSTKEAIEYLGIAQSTYYNRIEKLGIKRQVRQTVTDEQIFQAYNVSKSLREAANLLGIHHSALAKRMNKLGIDFNDKHDFRKYNIDDEVFSTINDEIAYWLGYIAADGSVVDNTLRFIINRQDEETLHRFLRFCKSSYEVHYHTAYYIDNDGVKHEFDAANLKINSKKIVSDLVKYGIVQNKKNMDIPFIEYIPEEYKIDFIIGFFDGDGSVTPENYSITIATNHQNLIGILKKFTELNIEFTVSNRSKIDVIYISKKESYLKFKNIYLSTSYSTMKRKYNKFKLR